MTDKCRNDCIDKLLFPKQPLNRPGLSRIDYRIGDYSDILEALHRKLNQNAALADWTHREADDPGIALLEGASILGDILTFYQQVYANEAYLRTAQWRESIADLVRLLGYRLSPGLGGKATFAFEVKGDKPVVIPAGFPVKAQLEGKAKSVDFQTVKEATVFPYLSEFNLFRTRLPAKEIKKGNSRIEVESVTFRGEDNPSYDVESIRGVNLEAGDRLILIPSGEILIVKGVEQVLDRTIIEIEGSLTSNHGTLVTAYRIGRSFRHFGHNAPAKYTYLHDSSNPKLKEDATIFWRWLTLTHINYGTTLHPKEMPLDIEVNDLATGSVIICQGDYKKFTSMWDVLREGSEIEHKKFTIPKKIVDLRNDDFSWGNLTGSSTVIILEENLISDANTTADIRHLRYHEVKGPKLKLRSTISWWTSLSKHCLNYWGTFNEALTLASRSLLLKKEGIDPLQVTVTTTREHINEILDSSHHDKTHPWLWPVSMNKYLGVFSLEDFDEVNPKVTVYGNLVEATQGKAEKEAILGNGDSRETFQTFKLPKAPLTYFLSKDETPPEIPELEIYVNDRLWRRVPSFYGHGPKEQIYIVREDDDNKSWVQFGDGKTGARLPSGIKNIVARYRTGTGAFGAIKEGASPQPGKQLDRLRKVYLPDVVSGGSGPEDGDNAREAAPGKVQSLGRLVSLQDFETEALGISGVEKVSANWRLENYIPTVVITALMESGRENEFDELQGVLAAYNIDRGPDRFPVSVHEAHRQYVYLTLDVGLDSSWYDQEQIKKSIKEVLGVTGEEDKGIDGSKGLFGIKQRRFGQREYSNRIEGVVQNVDGVIWAGVSLFGVLPAIGDDPLELTRPEPGQYHSVIPIARSIMIQQFPGFSWKEKGLKKQTIKSLNVEFDDILFCLHAAHLKIIPATADTTEVTTDD